MARSTTRWQWLGLLASLVLGDGCRSRSPTSLPATPTTAAATTDARLTPGTTPLTPPPVSAEPTGSAPPREPDGEEASSAPPTLPPMQQVVPLPSPFPESALVVTPLVHQSPVVLFPEESLAIRRRVAKQLRAHGWRVADVAKIEAIEAAAARKTLVLEDGQTCRAPLRPDEVHTRYFARSPRADAIATCLDGCELHVNIADPKDEDVSDTFVGGRVRAPHDPRSWARVRLRSPRLGVMGGVVGGVVMSSHPPPIMFQDLVPIGPWDSPPQGPPRGLPASLSSCAHPDPSIGLDWDLRLAVASDGAVSRCTASSSHTQARPRDGACLCRHLETLRFEAGKPGRRLRTGAIDDRTLGPDHDAIVLRQPGTEPWVTRVQQAMPLSHCIRTVGATPPLDAVAALWLAPDGTVEDVQLQGDISTLPAMKFAACLTGRLRTIALPCRPPGVDVLQLGIQLPSRDR
ncbi:MAG: hypothetical protein K0V04_17335 [Deltaproteobacteria bacterium]|nr:hypothetical protein [Deltaproteobacteria bacterium]